jgi:3-deoxy-D-manno-octulosonate 8-phosphate phosphatase (KDO 8-P phosphatase)
MAKCPSASFISTIFSKQEFDRSVKRISAGLRKKAKPIVLLLLDVDGVLTDGRIIIDDRGVETKNFHVRDGQGIALLARGGIEVGFITARSSRSLTYRAKELGVRLIRQAVRDKLRTYNEIKCMRKLQDRQIAYMGDDIVDLPTLRQAGLALSVSDAWSGLGSTVDFVTSTAGGEGAVREVAELLLKAQGKWATTLAKIG